MNTKTSLIVLTRNETYSVYGAGLGSNLKQVFKDIKQEFKNGFNALDEAVNPPASPGTATIPAPSKILTPCEHICIAMSPLGITTGTNITSTATNGMSLTCTC